MNRIRKAVIPAAGLGTRFLPFTKAVPKEMLPVVDTPAIEILVNEIVESGIKEVLIVTSEEKQAIKNHFSPAVALETALKKAGKVDLYTLATRQNDLAEISFINQNEPKGLADAVYYAKDFAGGEPFALLLGDDVVFNSKKTATSQLIDVFNSTGKCVLGVQKIATGELSKYGVLKLNGNISGADRIYAVGGVTEKPKDNPPSDLAILGRYIFTADIFRAIEVTNPRESAGEVYLTDAFDYIIAHHGLLAVEFEGIRYDLGDKLGYLKATVEYALRDNSLGAEFKKYLKGLGL